MESIYSTFATKNYTFLLILILIYFILFQFYLFKSIVLVSLFILV